MDSPLLRVIDASLVDPISSLRVKNQVRDEETREIVSRIIEDVRSRGDAALLEVGRKFDAPDLKGIAMTSAEIETSEVKPEHLEAISTSVRRVRDFHERQLHAITKGLVPVAGGYGWNEGGGSVNDPEFGPGALGQRLLPVRSAGIYVPGGGAPYASAVIMNAVPALVAGVGRVVVTSPPSQDGLLSPGVRAALSAVGIHEVYKTGGAAAIAALAFGTESVPRVDMVAGPGNRFVNEAKRQLWGTVGVDGFAGPSEVCVLADDLANPEWAAADLLTQIEHAQDNAAFLITLSSGKMGEILEAVENQLQGSKHEKSMRMALRNESLGVVARDMSQACDLVNAIAPEHLTLAVGQPEGWLSQVRNAGCVLLGENTPESAGDFCLGPSHTLPTGGASRFGSPLNVLTFMRWQSVAHATRTQIEPLISVIQAFGEMEGFPAHAFDAVIRQ